METAWRFSYNPYMALLCYQATSLLWCNLSPSELLMRWWLRTNLPVCKEELKPGMESFQRQDKAFKEKQKKDHDCHHRALASPLIPEDTHMWTSKLHQPQ